MISEFTAAPSTPFNVQQHFHNGTGVSSNRPLVKLTDGSIIKGGKATLNEDKFRATAQKENRLFVECSLPVVLRGENVHPVTDAGEFRRGLRKLQSLLDENGIYCTLEDEKLSRVDICRNVKTSAPITAYEQGLKRQTVPHLMPRDNGYSGVKWVSVRSGDGYPNRELTFYNKTDEAGLETPRIQRIEYRLQRKRAVEEALGTVSTSALCQTFDPVRAAFRGIISELLPPAESLQVSGTTGDCGYGGSTGKSTSNSTHLRHAGQNGTGAEENSGEAPHQPCVTSDEIKETLARQYEKHGPNCHALNRTAWVLLVLLHPEPDRLEKKFEVAADSDAGPSRGKYSVREKFEEAREDARMHDSSLRADGELLLELREQLLAASG